MNIVGCNRCIGTGYIHSFHQKTQCAVCEGTGQMGIVSVKEKSPPEIEVEAAATKRKYTKKVIK